VCFYWFIALPAFRTLKNEVINMFFRNVGLFRSTLHYYPEYCTVLMLPLLIYKMKSTDNYAARYDFTPFCYTTVTLAEAPHRLVLNITTRTAVQCRRVYWHNKHQQVLRNLRSADYVTCHGTSRAAVLSDSPSYQYTTVTGKCETKSVSLTAFVSYSH
jgi:hypothetical protein